MIRVAVAAIALSAIIVGLTLDDKTTPTVQLPRLGYQPYQGIWREAKRLGMFTTFADA